MLFSQLHIHAHQITEALGIRENGRWETGWLTGLVQPSLGKGLPSTTAECEFCEVLNAGEETDVAELGMDSREHPLTASLDD